MNERLNKMDAEDIYTFALSNSKMLEKSQVEYLTDLIIEKGDTYYMYLFARDVSKANLTKLEDAIIESNDSFLVYWFAKHVVNANKKKMEEVVINSQDDEPKYLFALFVKDADTNRIMNSIKNEVMIREIKEKNKIKVLKR